MIKAVIKLKDGREIGVNLDEECAPISVANFIELAKSGFYKGLIFHRVIKNFMIQCGGMDEYMTQRDTAKTIKGEFSQNGIENNRAHVAGTLSMARTMVNDSASSQFFICSVDTPHLDGAYAGFGEVASEADMKIVEEISNVKTKNVGYYQDVPSVSIVIEDIEILD